MASVYALQQILDTFIGAIRWGEECKEMEVVSEERFMYKFKTYLVYLTFVSMIIIKGGWLRTLGRAIEMKQKNASMAEFSCKMFVIWSALHIH